jgi:hypothetical protein
MKAKYILIIVAAVLFFPQLVFAHQGHGLIPDSHWHYMVSIEHYPFVGIPVLLLLIIFHLKRNLKRTHA